MSAEIDEAAARWHVAQADDDMDWTAFTDWLEADPRHRETYDAIALLDARIDAARPMLARLLPAEPENMPRRSPRMAIWGAVAALLTRGHRRRPPAIAIPAGPPKRSPIARRSASRARCDWPTVRSRRWRRAAFCGSPRRATWP
jgi:hypothetical protein